LPYVANYGHISIVEELIVDRDAEVNARDDEGKTALGRARYKSYDDIVSYLDYFGATSSEEDDNCAIS
jgi:ankyrin repeat protein